MWSIWELYFIPPQVCLLKKLQVPQNAEIQIQEPFVLACLKPFSFIHWVFRPGLQLNKLSKQVARSCDGVVVFVPLVTELA